MFEKSDEKDIADLRSVFSTVRERAEKGCHKEQFILAKCYFKGDIVEQNPVEGLKWLISACDLLSPEALELIKELRENSAFLAPIVENLKKEAEAGDYGAVYCLSDCLWQGIGVLEDKRESLKLLAFSAAGGHARSLNRIGFLLFEQGRGDHRAAFHYYQRAAKQGDPIACYNIGIAYAEGKGVEKDLAKAAEWMRKAAELDFAEAQYAMHDILEAGENCAPGTKEFDEAHMWLEEAFQQGHEGAKKLFADGPGIPLNPDRPQLSAGEIAVIRENADRGDASAQVDLAMRLLSGDGVDMEPAKAVEYLRRAAAQGDTTALNNLAFCLLTGKGVDQNPAEAVRMYDAAAAMGDANAENSARMIRASGFLKE